MNHTKTYISGTVGVISLILIDRITKYLAFIYLKDNSIVLIRGALELQYLENSGAAWGMMSGRHTFFVLIALIITAFLVFYYIRMPYQPRYRPLRFVFILLCAGALGNMIDRITNGYVIDFIYFSLIDFPVFNFADICVSVSAVLLIILILFYYSDDELSFFRIGKKGKKA